MIANCFGSNGRGGILSVDMALCGYTAAMSQVNGLLICDKVATSASGPEPPPPGTLMDAINMHACVGECLLGWLVVFYLYGLLTRSGHAFL